VNRTAKSSLQSLVDLLRDRLARGESVDIPDLGTFEPGPGSGFQFTAHAKPHVFIAYVREDAGDARRLYRDLQRHDFNPWLDKERLLPGQNWPRAIELAIENADFFIPCFSRRSVSKRGVFHSELRYALDCADRTPLDDVFIIPVRLDDCAVPRGIASKYHCIDLHPDWNRGLARIVAVIEEQVLARAQRT